MTIHFLNIYVPTSKLIDHNKMTYTMILKILIYDSINQEHYNFNNVTTQLTIYILIY